MDHRHRFWMGITAVWLVSAWIMAPSAQGTIYYVDAASGNDEADGTSWETANRTIFGVFEKNPDPGDEIRVAEGRYIEPLELAEGISLIGGFEFGGDQSLPDQYLSIIDGCSEHRCVIGANGALLQGFTLENGWSTHGSGLLHHDITMTVRQCIIRNCMAYGGNPQGGGAMYFYQSQSLIDACLFEENGVNQAPEFTSSESIGGAVMSWVSEPKFYNCRFLNNRVWETPAQTLRLGGAMWFIASGPVVRGCVFEGNSATTGGGFGCWNRSRPTIEDCVFRNNTAVSLGGGLCHIYNEKDTPSYPVVVRNCRFESNTAEKGAGMAVLRNNLVEIDNCLFTGNQSSAAGCGLSMDLNSICIVSNCTFADNAAQDIGIENACIDIDDSSRLTLKDSIVSTNETFYGIRMAEGGDALMQAITFCNVTGHYRNYSANLVDRTGWTGNISVSPRFTYFNEERYCLSDPRTGDAQQIQLGRSPCIDTGGYHTYGSQLAYASTRTDMIRDELQADMGFHRFGPGPRLMADQPFAGAYAVPLDIVIICRLINVLNDLSEADVVMKLNGDAIPFQMAAIPGGYEITAEPSAELEMDMYYEMDVVAHIESEDYWFTLAFSTAEAPAPPPPPQGEWLELDFPMTETVFVGGDFLAVSVTTYNPWLNPVAAHLHIAFEFAGEYYIYPVWDLNLHPVGKNLYPGVLDTQEILSFIVPGGIGNVGPVNFFALATPTDSFDLISDVAAWSMYFSD